MNNQDIINVIRQNKYKLLGEILISDEEREKLKNYVRVRLTLAIRGGSLSTKEPDIRFVLGLTQIVIEGYEGAFWDTLANFAKVPDQQGNIKKISQKLQTEIGEYVLMTLREADLFTLPPEETSFKYAENLKCQALVPDKYMSDWFDFWYDYYRKNLLYCLDDFSDDDITAISRFMKGTLQDGEKEISFGWGKTPKSYRLLISTRRVLAYCSGTAVPELIKITLRMMDDYIHLQKIPDPGQPFYGRFERCFEQWTKLMEQRDPTEHPVRRQGLYSQAPYLYLDSRDQRVKLCIPPQRFLASDAEAKERIVGSLTNGGNVERFELSIYHAFGRVITEEIPPFEIHDPFAEITVHINGKLRMHLPALPYRLFHANEEDLSLTRYVPSNRTCYLLCRVDADVKAMQELMPLELPDVQGYEITPDLTGDIYVDGMKLPRVERSGNTLCHPYILPEYHAKQAETKLDCCAEHPIICLSLTREQLQRAVLRIGERSWDSTILARYASPAEEDSELMNIELDLSDLITEDGVYHVTLHIEGQATETIGQYCLLRRFSIRPKPKYCLPGEKIDLLVGYKEHKQRISVTADVKGEFCCQPAMRGNPRICYDLPVIRWGSTIEEIDECPSQIWHKDLDTSFCVRCFGAKALEIRIGGKVLEVNCCDLQKGIFHADLLEVLEMIDDSPEIAIPVFLRPILSGSQADVPDIKLFSIIRRVDTIPELLLQRSEDGGVKLVIDSFVGQGDLFLDIRDAQDGTLCAEALKLRMGQTILEGLDPSGTYTLHRFMMEKRSVFDAQETRVDYPVIRSCCVDLNDPLDTHYCLSEVSAVDEVRKPAAEVKIIFEEPCGEETYRGSISYRRQNDSKFSTLGNIHLFRIIRTDGAERFVQVFPANSDYNTICLMHDSRMLVRRSAPSMRNCRPADYTCLSDDSVLLHLIPYTRKEFDS